MLEPQNRSGDRENSSQWSGMTLSRRDALVPCTDGHVRILQQTPAWDLHLLLRVLDIPYETDNILFPIAAGQELPLLIHGNVISCAFSPVINKCPLNRENIDYVTCASFTRQVGDFISEGANHLTSYKKLREVSTFGGSILYYYYNLNICKR